MMTDSFHFNLFIFKVLNFGIEKCQKVIPVNELLSVYFSTCVKVLKCNQLFFGKISISDDSRLSNVSKYSNTVYTCDTFI